MSLDNSVLLITNRTVNYDSLGKISNTCNCKCLLRKVCVMTKSRSYRTICQRCIENIFVLIFYNFVAVILASRFIMKLLYVRFLNICDLVYISIHFLKPLMEGHSCYSLSRVFPYIAQTYILH